MRAGPAFCRAGLGSSAQWEPPVWPSRSRRWPSRSLEDDLPGGAGRRVCRGGCGARGPTGKRPDHDIPGTEATLRGAFEQNLDAQLALEARLQGQCQASVYFHKGIGGVFEKSGPRCFMASGPGRLGRINPDIKWGTAAAQRQRRHLGKTGHRRVWRPFGTGPRDK